MREWKKTSVEPEPAPSEMWTYALSTFDYVKLIQGKDGSWRLQVSIFSGMRAEPQSCSKQLQTDAMLFAAGVLEKHLAFLHAELGKRSREVDSPATGDPVERVVEATEAAPPCSARTP